MLRLKWWNNHAIPRISPVLNGSHNRAPSEVSDVRISVIMRSDSEIDLRQTVNDESNANDAALWR